MIPENKFRYTEETGCIELDELIGGGYPRKMVTQIYGEPGSGKSTLCLIAAIHTLRAGKSVIYIDTECFSVERFSQIAGEDTEALADRFYLYEPADFDQQRSMVDESERLLAEKKAGLIVVDSITSHYRAEIDVGQDMLRRLTKQTMVLLGYAKRYDVPVLITNQVFTSLPKNDYAPLGGNSLLHITKVVLRIDKIDQFRRIRITKHHSKPEGAYLDFVMTGDGILVTNGPVIPENPWIGKTEKNI